MITCKPNQKICHLTENNPHKSDLRSQPLDWIVEHLIHKQIRFINNNNNKKAHKPCKALLWSQCIRSCGWFLLAEDRFWKHQRPPSIQSGVLRPTSSSLYRISASEWEGKNRRKKKATKTRWNCGKVSESGIRVCILKLPYASRVFSTVRSKMMIRRLDFNKSVLPNVRVKEWVWKSPQVQEGLTY